MQPLTQKTHHQLFESKEHYLAFRQAWRETVNSDFSFEALDFVIYALLRGRDYHKCFTPITNKNKLANGGDSDYTDAKKCTMRTLKSLVKLLDNPDKKLYSDLTNLEYVGCHLGAFKGTVSPEMIGEVAHEIN